jgi:Zn-dependent peptidase ImmA (M78 family)
MVNDDRPVTRKRFSLAHEIGHFALNHGPLSFLSNFIDARDIKQEREANKFASELLMPKRILARYGFLTPEKISSLCNVSLQAATIRAGQMGWG